VVVVAAVRVAVAVAVAPVAAAVQAQATAVTFLARRLPLAAMARQRVRMVITRVTVLMAMVPLHADSLAWTTARVRAVVRARAVPVLRVVRLAAVARAARVPLVHPVVARSYLARSACFG
jgi:hypothetical protein